MKSDNLKNRTARDYLLLGFKGFCMGAADVVPGVSGGTMAFILGIYQELIFSIKSINLNFIKKLSTGAFKDAINVVPWKFLVAVATGIFTAVFTIASFLSYMLHTYPVWVWSFFFGLVLASAVTICLEIEKWTIKSFAGIILGTVLSFHVVGQVPVSTPETPWFLFISGALAICAMILPGISGAFILVLLGKYQFVLEAVSQRDLLPLAVVAFGALAGLLSFVRLLNWLFNQYREMTIALLVGLMFGSLRKIWPWKKDHMVYDDIASEWMLVSQINVWPGHLDFEMLTAVFLMMIGIFSVIFMHYLVKTKL